MFAAIATARHNAKPDTRVVHFRFHVRAIPIPPLSNGLIESTLIDQMHSDL
jgi:hypothetical protein